MYNLCWLLPLNIDVSRFFRTTLFLLFLLFSLYPDQILKTDMLFSNTTLSQLIKYRRPWNSPQVLALLNKRLIFLLFCMVILKWYYDQKIISFFSSDFESVFAKCLTGKILSFAFYLNTVYFECKFWISRSTITHVQNWPIGHQKVGSRENDVIYSLAQHFSV